MHSPAPGPHGPGSHGPGSPAHRPHGPGSPTPGPHGSGPAGAGSHDPALHDPLAVPVGEPLYTPYSLAPQTQSPAPAQPGGEQVETVQARNRRYAALAVVAILVAAVLAVAGDAWASQQDTGYSAQQDAPVIPAPAVSTASPQPAPPPGATGLNDCRRATRGVDVAIAYVALAEFGAGGQAQECVLHDRVPPAVTNSLSRVRGVPVLYTLRGSDRTGQQFRFTGSVGSSRLTVRVQQQRSDHRFYVVDVHRA